MAGGSRYCLVATSGANGACDVSPKGDPAGFTHVLDDRTVVLPERPGNRRADGFHNVLHNPHVGLLYLVAGRDDTLRINGSARIVKNGPFFDALTCNGHRPKLALLVEIEEVFYHCPKAFMRSELWSPEAWQPDALPTRAQIVQAVENQQASLAELEQYYGPSYHDRLYRG